MQYYPTTRKKQTDALNSIYENLSKDTATFKARCKQYFSVEFW